MGQVWRSYSLTMTCDPQLQMAKQGLSGGSGPEETLLGAGRGRIQAAGLHTRPHCRPLPASGASVPTWVDSTGRTGLQSGCTHKVTAGNGAHNRAAGGGKPRTTRRQEWSPSLTVPGAQCPLARASSKPPSSALATVLRRAPNLRQASSRRGMGTATPGPWRDSPRAKAVTWSRSRQAAAHGWLALWPSARGQGGLGARESGLSTRPAHLDALGGAGGTTSLSD